MSDFRTPHPDNIKALLKCRAHGIAVCICTGRNFHGIRDLVRQVPFDRFAVINNGAAIYDIETDTLRYRNRFARETAEQILAIGATYEGASLSVSTTNERHVLEHRLSDEARQRWQRLALIDPGFAEGVVLHDSIEELVDACEDDMQRITLGIDIFDVDKLQEVYARLSEITGVEITAGGVQQMEISPKDGTKAEALSVLADIYGAAPENVLALGDNFNDLHMLVWAGTSVAMGNADERLKAVATYVTDTNKNGGVAKAIERIVFGNTSA
jgi:hypothetical protein